MRKVVLLTGLVFLLSLMVASAGTPRSAQPASAPDVDTFLASLSAPSLTPAPIQRTACEVSKDCVCGGGTVTISCSGDVSCQVKPRSVVCDNVTTNCPPIGSCPP
jgi:hypothetical protein